MLKKLVMVAALGTLAACQTANPDVVNRYDAQRMSSVQDATVLSLRPVTLQGRDSGVGTVGGAVIGGIAGSNVGGPRTGGIVGIVGAIAGGLIGNAVERDATRENAVEILVQLKNGERRAVIQGLGAETFAVGDPVIMITTGGRVRVMRAPPVTTGTATPAPYPASYPAAAQQ
ncbi:MAG: glycine zipper 2TM domain-containing protein [Betaproteobacteria bacterium]